MTADRGDIAGFLKQFLRLLLKHGVVLLNDAFRSGIEIWGFPHAA
jgi:hypothetical protein